MKGNFIRINNILSKNKSDYPVKCFMQNQTKNHEFFILFKKRPKDDLILARKHFPTLSRAYKTRWGQWSLNLNFFPPWGH